MTINNFETASQFLYNLLILKVLFGINHSYWPKTRNYPWYLSYVLIIHSWLPLYSCRLNKHEANSFFVIHLFPVKGHHDVLKMLQDQWPGRHGGWTASCPIAIPYCRFL